MDISWAQFLLVFIGISSLVALTWVVIIFFAMRSLRVGAKAFKEAKALGKNDQEATDLSLKAVKDLDKARGQDTRFITAKHLISRVGNLFALGFIGYFFHQWMSITARDWMATTGGMIHEKVIFGILIGTAVLVIIRGFVKDPGPNWAVLEQRLMLISFLAVFFSCAGSATRLLLTQTS